MSDECLDEINERSTSPLDIVFVDDEGNPVTPDAATYRIDDEFSKRNILPATAISPLDDEVTIVVTADQNRIINRRRVYEVRSLVIEFDYGADRHGTQKFRYKVINLFKGLVYPVSASVSPSTSASPST